MQACRLLPKRVGVIGDPLAKRSRRRSDDVEHGGGHESWLSESRSPGRTITDLEFSAVSGAREDPVSRLMGSAVLAEPDELDKGAIVHDHGCSDAFRRRPGRIDDFLALESSLEVVDFECHMGHGLDELGQGTGLLEPHPLHAVRAGTETRHVEAILSEMSLSRVLDVGWNADVVIAPATLRYRGWGLMAESAVRRSVLGVRHCGDSH